MSVWEQRTSQLRRHMQMSSQEGLNKDPPLLNPHASLFRRRKPLENSGPEKGEEEAAGRPERAAGDGQEQQQQQPPGPNACPSLRGEQRSPSPRARREQWQHKSFHGNCGLGEQDGGGSTGFEERARLRQSVRRSRHRRVRTEAREHRPAGPEAGAEAVSPAKAESNGEQKEKEEEKEALIEKEQVAGEELGRDHEAPANGTGFVAATQEPSPTKAHLGLDKEVAASPPEQDGSSLDTSEQALLGNLPRETGRTISRSEPDLSSISTNVDKATESTTIMIDVQDSTVVQSEDPSLFLFAHTAITGLVHFAVSNKTDGESSPLKEAEAKEEAGAEAEKKKRKKEKKSETGKPMVPHSSMFIFSTTNP
ncbi:Voltage-dependent R-type calcium channel subunit alpha-1E [Varanus komodoensis]|nr:Voltage-dependent R-type calcium channel subunit alpha-1E [Varanus komodoensis]